MNPKPPTVVGPNGEKRSRDVIASAANARRIAVGLDKGVYVKERPEATHPEEAESVVAGHCHGEHLNAR